jgi:hypothetical protein
MTYPQIVVMKRLHVPTKKVATMMQWACRYPEDIRYVWRKMAELAMSYQHPTCKYWLEAADAPATLLPNEDHIIRGSD